MSLLDCFLFRDCKFVNFPIVGLKDFLSYKSPEKWTQHNRGYVSMYAVVIGREGGWGICYIISFTCGPHTRQSDVCVWLTGVFGTWVKLTKTKCSKTCRKMRPASFSLHKNIFLCSVERSVYLYKINHTSTWHQYTETSLKFFWMIIDWSMWACCFNWT